MDAIIEHVKKTCPHFKNKSRQALRNNRFDLYVWETAPRMIPITTTLKNKCKPCSPRDVAKYQKLIKRGSLPPAIVIGDEQDILDGAHRLQALINEGFSEVLVWNGRKKK